MNNSSRGHEGTMTNSALVAMVRRAVAERLGDSVAADATKTEQLQALMQADGARAVVQVGLQFAQLPAHPVLTAMTSGPSVTGVLSRWIRLERFGHTRNRTELIGSDADADEDPHHASVRHVADDGGPIHPVNDLFVWGLLIALLQRAGFEGIRASLGTSDTSECVLYDDGSVQLQVDPPTTQVVVLRCSTRRTTIEPATTPPPSTDISVSLPRLMQRDLVRTWRVDEAAKALALSSRQLQRRLTEAGTSFSETLQRTRVEAAHAMMHNRGLSLTEIAFCTGFSDLAHFSRLFKRTLEVTPSALRDLMYANDTTG